jgi:hypothetical protein
VGSGGALASGGSLASGGALAAGAGGSSGGSAAGATSGGAASGGTSAGSGGAGAADGGVAGADAGTGTDGGATAVRPPCLQDPNQIVMIGDSYVNWITHTFPTDMNAASGLSIADYAIGGTSMGSGGIGLIPPQFDTALQTHPNILAVIMDGGGNDILVPDTVQFPNGGQCKNDGAQSPSIPDCQAIVQKALDAGAKLFAHMADSGVKDAIYFFYPHVPTNTWLATDPNGMLDYALPKIQAACDGAYEASLQVNPAKPIRCHFVNMVPVFQGHPEYFANADLHPNSTGSKAMAAAIWARMKKDCVAQPASSGCCSPD